MTKPQILKKRKQGTKNKLQNFFLSAKSDCRASILALDSYCRDQAGTFPTVLKLKVPLTLLALDPSCCVVRPGTLAETGKSKVSIYISLERFYFFGGYSATAGAGLLLPCMILTIRCPRGYHGALGCLQPLVLTSTWAMCKGGSDVPRSWVLTSQANGVSLFLIATTARKIWHKNMD